MLKYALSAGYLQNEQVNNLSQGDIPIAIGSTNSACLRRQVILLTDGFVQSETIGITKLKVPVLSPF